MIIMNYNYSEVFRNNAIFQISNLNPDVRAFVSENLTHLNI